MNAKKMDEKKFGLLEQALIYSLKAVVVIFLVLALFSTLSTAYAGANTSGTSCSDSDNGKDYYVSGATTGSGGYGAPVTNVYSDSCFSDTQLREYYCQPAADNKIWVTDETVDAPTNYICHQGRFVSQESCTDSDGGENYYSTGTTIGTMLATGSTSGFKDECISGTQLTEYYCINDYAGEWPASKTITCSNGYACSDGACIQTVVPVTVTPTPSAATSTPTTTTTTTAVATTPTKYCKETDGGNDKYAQGTNTIYNADGSVFTSQSDYCYSSSQVAEFTCSGGQWDVSYESCPTNYACSNGACVQTTTTTTTKCIDSDGSNIYSKGTATGLDYYLTGTISSSDSCAAYSGGPSAAGSWVLEEECLSDGRISGNYYECPRGYTCSDGACVSAGVTFVCSETDVGADIYTQGKTVYGNEVGVDECLNSNWLQEFYCYTSEGKSLKGVEKRECPSGYVCSDGACIRSAVEVVPVNVTAVQPTPKPIPAVPVPTTAVEPVPPEKLRKTLSISLARGWNMFSVPFENAVTDSDCTNFVFDKVWTYDTAQKTYVHPTSFESGVGYWFKAREACSIKTTGDVYSISGKQLSPGWNQIGSQTYNINFYELEQECTFSKGPWAWNAQSQMWQRAAEMQPGEAYFVKVENACTLGGEEIPPLPE